MRCASPLLPHSPLLFLCVTSCPIYSTFLTSSPPCILFIAHSLHVTTMHPIYSTFFTSSPPCILFIAHSLHHHHHGYINVSYIISYTPMHHTLTPLHPATSPPLHHYIPPPLISKIITTVSLHHLPILPSLLLPTPHPLPEKKKKKNLPRPSKTSCTSGRLT